MTFLAVFMVFYILFFVIFIFIWGYNVIKSNLARDFAQLELDKHAILKLDPLNQFESNQNQLLISPETEYSDSPESPLSPDNQTDFLLDITSAYIARNRVPILKSVISEILNEPRFLKLVGGVRTEQFRNLVRDKINESVEKWIDNQTGTVIQKMPRTVYHILTSLIVDKYVTNFRELKQYERTRRKKTYSTN